MLETSPHPRPYRRIRPDRGSEEGFVLALGEWRVAFALPSPQTVAVSEIRSGYRARERDAHPLHAEFVRGPGAP